MFHTPAHKQTARAKLPGQIVNDPRDKPIDVVDVQVSGGGSTYLFTPITKRAKAWVDAHVQLESWQWLGSGFGVEHRYAGELAQGMINDGLTVA